MKRLSILICGLCWSLPLQTSVRAAEDQIDTAALVYQLQNGSDPAASGEAFMQLRQTLRSAQPELTASIQIRIYQALQISNDARAIRRLAMVLSAAPSEEGVVILTRRLSSDLPQAMSMAVCDGLRAIAGQRPSLSASVVSLALERLEAIARSPQLPGPVVESAVMAIAAFGSPGCDQLMKLKNQGTASGKIQDVLYTAFSETDDPRALAVLREAIQDVGSFDSRRAQAIHGLGQIFARAASAGRAIDPAERTACVSLVEAYLHDATPDRVFASALKASVRMVEFSRDFRLQEAVSTALRSATEVRRAAALEVLSQHRGPLDSHLSATVRELAESDSSMDVRSAAAAVLDKEQEFQTAVLPDAQQ